MGFFKKMFQRLIPGMELETLKNNAHRSVSIDFEILSLQREKEKLESVRHSRMTADERKEFDKLMKQVNDEIRKLENEKRELNREDREMLEIMHDRYRLS